MVTGFEEQLLRSISREELFEAFAKWDTDATGSISFENFVTGGSFLKVKWDVKHAYGAVSQLISQGHGLFL